MSADKHTAGRQAKSAAQAARRQEKADRQRAKDDCRAAKRAAKQEAGQQRAEKKQQRRAQRAYQQAAQESKCLRREHDRAFLQLTAAMNDRQQQRLRSYFGQVSQHILLPREWKQPLLRDFERGIAYHLRRGQTLERTLELLDPLNLGGFYSSPASMWWPLDNAAKVYPISMSHDQMEVFRLSVYLREEVVPEILQLALDFTIKRFPFFATTVKNGFFWHYIDAAKRRFAVEPERTIPCAPMNVSLTGAQSFRIVYYRNRVSAEFFHILTDGSGGMVFLKSLIAEYLRLLGHDIPCGCGVLDINERPDPAESADDFAKAAVKGRRGSGFAGKPARQMSGYLTRTKPCQVLHFELDAGQLHQHARERGVSVTVYTLGLMFVAGKAATEENDGMIQIQVPVNMRQYYPSSTIRNFSLYCSIGLPVGEITTVDEILPRIASQLQQQGSRESMLEMMNSAVQLVNSLKYVPRVLKTALGKYVYGFFSDRIFSNTLSNLGVIDLPEEMRPYIEKMDFVLGMSPTNRAACSMVTVNNTTVLSIAKATADPTFEEKIYALLKENGLPFSLSGSELYGN